jgi:hypothetical protein
MEELNKSKPFNMNWGILGKDMLGHDLNLLQDEETIIITPEDIGIPVQNNEINTNS